MSEFWVGVAASLIAAGLVYVTRRFLWPVLWERVFYRGVNLSGVWQIVEERNGVSRVVGKIELKQIGRRLTGSSLRSQTRGGESSNRKFAYTGSMHGHQATLLFEDQKGVGFDVGTYVFIVQNDGNTMIGNTTFHGKTENKIVSESRTLKRVLE
ncbi:MAG: hypothetical protein ACTIDY_01540 [Halomonadaceae bacterium]|uniref:SMODS-associating 2TM beta-strand rich effector domain-containing protein n=1 Tax=Halomonas colorata TaxID=2742615 RepID=A0ABR9FTV9_9GAMM|nr:hypothetical protein [Halomonas colorata]MBE0462095.1 hypothetical protein [Halomonas colorata]